MWLCKHHNSINERMGKQPFPCDPKLLDLRWRKGMAQCWHGNEASVTKARPKEDAPASV